MQVTPVGKKFGDYKPGDAFDLPEKAANHLIKAGLLQAISNKALEPEISTRTGKPKRQYIRRDMVAE